jgi:hypothetical protein
MRPKVAQAENRDSEGESYGIHADLFHKQGK